MNFNEVLESSGLEYSEAPLKYKLYYIWSAAMRAKAQPLTEEEIDEALKIAEINYARSEPVTPGVISTQHDIQVYIARAVESTLFRKQLAIGINNVPQTLNESHVP